VQSSGDSGTQQFSALPLGELGGCLGRWVKRGAEKGQKIEICG